MHVFLPELFSEIVKERMPLNGAQVSLKYKLSSRVGHIPRADSCLWPLRRALHSRGLLLLKLSPGDFASVYSVSQLRSQTVAYLKGVFSDAC